MSRRKIQCLKSNYHFPLEAPGSLARYITFLVILRFSYCGTLKCLLWDDGWDGVWRGCCNCPSWLVRVCFKGRLRLPWADWWEGVLRGDYDFTELTGERVFQGAAATAMITGERVFQGAATTARRWQVRGCFRCRLRLLWDDWWEDVSRGGCYCLELTGERMFQGTAATALNWLVRGCFKGRLRLPWWLVRGCFKGRLRLPWDDRWGVVLGVGYDCPEMTNVRVF